DTIRKWVYGVCVVVEKVGGKRFPDGVLLQNVHSWISPKALSLIGPKRANTNEPVVAPVVQDTPVAVPAVQAPPVVAPVVQDTPVVVPVVQDTPVVVPVAPIIPIVEEPIKPAEPVQPAQPAKPAKPAQPVQPVQPASETHRFSLGIRGGVASMMQKADNADWKIGFDALLDLQYGYYKTIAQGHKIGFLLGVSAGYVRNSLQADAVYDQFTIDDINYTVTAKSVKEQQAAIMVEVPVMFSMVTKGGFFMNVGPRFQLPVYTHNSLQFDQPSVKAYFPTERVDVIDELITGRVDGKVDTKCSYKAPVFNLLVGLEIGYEWQLKNNDALGLGVYGNYGVYSLYSNKSDAHSIVGITAPTALVQPASIDYNSMMDAYGSSFGFFDAGVKLTYHFNFRKH
ncbi:MAG: hypothetical protein MJZ64_07330, partial [Paludibacteraceae bacterium]|nr:hypothetical protein [Paludibacteraceae bacterium]